LPPVGETVIRPRIRHIPALLCAAAAVAFGIASAATAEPGPVASKQAEAQSIISQINSIEVELSSAVERWNLANVKLANIGHDLSRSRWELGVARVNLKHAQTALARQALSVYTSSDSNGTIEVLLGSSSLDDLLNRIDTVNRVSDQSSSVVGDVTTFRTNVARETARLHRAQSEQKRIVAERVAEKQSIQSKLAERNRLLQSVRAEIEHLRVVEAARQAAIARQLREQQARQALQPQVAAMGTAVGDAQAVPAAAPAPAAPAASVAAPPSTHGGVVGGRNAVPRDALRLGRRLTGRNSTARVS
jgi:peptidoglycan hydrolase CwlO-like protein